MSISSLVFTIVTDPRNYAQTFFHPETTTEACIDSMGIQSPLLKKNQQQQ